LKRSTIERCARAPAACAALALLGLAPATMAAGALRDDPEARPYVAFTEDFAATCVQRQGVQILVKSTHPTRPLQLWLERFHMGTGTGDRSRSLLKPGEEPQPLGCSRTLSGEQEWRIVRVVFAE
jgi:hypothetical protein